MSKIIQLIGEENYNKCSETNRALLQKIYELHDQIGVIEAYSFIEAENQNQSTS